MFSDLNGNGQVTETEIIQVEHYYPFGMSQEGHGNAIISETAYTYNGKELNSDFGLDLHDYGARWYDASIGRWHGVDPLAEAFSVHSPYNYGVNNPIMMVDPDGRSATAAGGGKDDENLHGGKIMYDKDGNPTSVHFGNNSRSSNTSSNNVSGGLMASEGASGGYSRPSTNLNTPNPKLKYINITLTKHWQEEKSRIIWNVLPTGVVYPSIETYYVDKSKVVSKQRLLIMLDTKEGQGYVAKIRKDGFNTNIGDFTFETDIIEDYEANGKYYFHVPISIKANDETNTISVTPLTVTVGDTKGSSVSSSMSFGNTYTINGSELMETVNYSIKGNGLGGYVNSKALYGITKEYEINGDKYVMTIDDSSLWSRSRISN
jgi:RHS repeat-associated protein